MRDAHKNTGVTHLKRQHVYVRSDLRVVTHAVQCGWVMHWVIDVGCVKTDTTVGLTMSWLVVTEGYNISMWI